jgi:hypothetical protein
LDASDRASGSPLEFAGTHADKEDRGMGLFGMLSIQVLDAMGPVTPESM